MAAEVALIRRSIPVLLVALTTLACAGIQGKPVPADRQDLVGSWRSAEVELDIEPAGFVRYEKENGAGHVSINGPVTEWTPDGFVVGLFGVGTTFRVDEPPHRVGDHWETIIDGVPLSRSSP
jgi:hypothetical protein